MRLRAKKPMIAESNPTRHSRANNTDDMTTCSHVSTSPGELQC